MVEIKPNSLYSRADLVELLRPLGVDADMFLARLRPRKVFRLAWLGEDLLEALRGAPALAERNALGSLLAPRQGRRRTRKRQEPEAARPLLDLIDELKGNKADGLSS